MTVNTAASVRTRLTTLAKQQGDAVDRVFLRYAIERLLYWLAQSAYRDQFVLKGAMLFSLWAPVPYRSTGDLDLLGQGDPAPERMAAIFSAICAAAATFERRGTPLPQGSPVALTKTCSDDAGKQSQWRAFLNRTTIAVAPEPLPDLVALIAEFVAPLVATKAATTMAGMKSQRGGPWVAADKNKIGRTLRFSGLGARTAPLPRRTTRVSAQRTPGCFRWWKRD